MNEPVFVVDNGAATIKAGFATEEKPHIIPNCKMKVKSERQRQYIGDQIEDCKDPSGLYYVLAHQKGFIVNWDTEREIWDYLFTRKFRDLVPKDTTIIITEPYFNFKPIQDNIDEILFEEYQFNAILRTNTGYLTSMNHKSQQTKSDPNNLPLACLVVDSGFSFTHITPYVHSRQYGYLKLNQGVRRIDVGGKALTNHLKEIVSYRQMNVMDETYVINQCKEDVCFVSIDFEGNLSECEKKQNKIARDYILPDFTNVKRGYVKKPDWRATTRLDTDLQFVRLANERFQVPEILFHPSDVGITQVGIVEAIVSSINSLPEKLHPFLYDNVILTGGNAKLHGFRERILKEVRSYCPSRYRLNVYSPDDPVTYAWFGGKALGTQFPEILQQSLITKTQYDLS